MFELLPEPGPKVAVEVHLELSGVMSDSDILRCWS